MISARGLAKHFTQRRNSVHAVRNVDIDVTAGEIVAFLGPNGAGKTTTLRMLTTLMRPTAGQATVAGCDLITDPAGVRARIGYVAQHGGAAPDCRVLEDLELQGRIHGLSISEARARSARLAAELDLGDVTKRLARTLSGGQRRRLDLALGLIHEPGLIFLDEPTNGLDPQSRANLWEHIRRLRADKGITIFLTTHYLDEADLLADKVFVIDHGTIVASGTPHELKQRVSGDGVTLGVPAHLRDKATASVKNLPDIQDLTTGTDTLRFRVSNGDTALPSILRALDAAQVPATSIAVARPTLDDVFLTLTGRSLRDAKPEEVAGVS